jgi:hypothetical protein
MNGNGQAELMTWLQDHGIYQVDAFLRVLLFIPFAGLNADRISQFTTHAMMAGLEFYMCKLAIYTRPPGVPPMTQGRLVIRQFIGTYQPITTPNFLMPLNTIHNIIYTYVQCYLSSSLDPMAHPNLNLAYGHKFSHLLQQIHVNTPDDFIRQFPYVLGQMKVLVKPGFIHDFYVEHIYQDALAWVMGQAVIANELHTHTDYTTLSSDENFTHAIYYVQKQSWTENPGHQTYGMLWSCHKIGINNLFQLWYQLPMINKSYANYVATQGYILSPEIINLYATTCHQHFMYITGQTMIKPPHLMVTMYATNRFDDEPSITSYHTDDFELEEDSEMSFPSDDDDDDSQGDNNNTTIHQTMFMTMDYNALVATKVE